MGRELCVSEQVLKYFRILEMYLCGTCLIVHAAGFLKRFESVGHVGFACGTFMSFLFLSCFEIAVSIHGHPSSIKTEQIISLIGFLCFLITTFLPMRVAEEDPHLPNLTHTEEKEHEVFYWGLRQSLFSLLATVTYHMHFLLAKDEVKRQESNPPELEVEPDVLDKNTIYELHLFCVEGANAFGFCLDD